MSLCLPEEEARSLEALAKHVKEQKLKEERGTRRSTREELVARSNARTKVVTKTDVKQSMVTGVFTEQVAKEKISPTGRRMGRELVTVVTRRQIPKREFLSIGCWGC